MAVNSLILSSILALLVTLSHPHVIKASALRSNRNLAYQRVRRNLYKSIHDYMDHTVEPCDNFYQHACGNWDKFNPIPDDVVDYKPVKALSLNTDLIVKDLLEDFTADIGNNTAEAKAKHLYSSCLNQQKRDELGVKPIVEFMQSLGAWPVLSANWSAEEFDWLETIGKLRQFGDQILIKENVNYNKTNSSSYVIYLDQGRLGLRSPANYLDSAYSDRLDAYRDYLANVLELFSVNTNEANQTANEIVNFETTLAQIMVPARERTNLSLFASGISVDDLQLNVTGLNWTKYLSIVFERPIPPTQQVVIKELKYMNDLVDLISKTDSRLVANYIFWRFVQFKVIRLASPFEKPFQYFLELVSGRVSNPPTWKMCVNDVKEHMKEVFGAMFVKHQFKESDRENVTNMLQTIKNVFLETIYNSSWLDLETKDLIRKKLDHMSFQIGYPDIINSTEKLNQLYQNLTVFEDRYFDNYLTLLRHTSYRKHRKVFEFSADEWSAVSLDLIGAYYNPMQNRITIPAGLLQQPIFDKFYTKAFNFGRMGVLIGHEMAHSVDNIGRNYDYKGYMKSWWNSEMVRQFNEKASCFSEQYSHYRIPYSDYLLDSKGTLSENIADNVGLSVAYKAYKSLAGVESKPGADSSVLTDDAVFFYSFAQLWCGYTRPEAILNHIRQESHSPGMWRVIGTLSNLEEFGVVFNCTKGGVMSSIKKCRMW